MPFIQLDIQFFSGEKTEKATPRKRQESRKKGQVLKSQDLNTAVMLLFGFGFLKIYGPTIISESKNLFQIFFTQYILIVPEINNLREALFYILNFLMVVLLPVMVLCFVAAALVNYAQVGFLFTTEPLQFKLSKIDPIQGFKRIYSLRALVELVKSILKIVFVGTVTFSFLYFNIEDVIQLSQIPLVRALQTVFNLMINIGLVGGLALIILSVFDYMYQKFDYEKQLRMSKQDIKDEYKKTEGDPLIKSKIKQKQREMAMRRMMAEIPNADVVITNPTHYAVALKYDETKADAPIVVAKGVDHVALKIRQIAQANDIYMIENRPLARALHDQTELDQPIPEEFFKAVAEILAYVYRLKNKVGAK